jgi:hypothetical protein
VDPFVDQLTRICIAYPTRSKWVLVPTHAIGRTLGERIAREGTNWLNLRFATLLDIALRMGAPFLVERGIHPSEEGLGPALMMRLLLDLPLARGYFRPLADHPTMAQALWTTVRELRMAGIHPGALKPEVFSSPAKHAELVALLSAYELFLDQHKRGDIATVYEEAVKVRCRRRPTQLEYGSFFAVSCVSVVLCFRFFGDGFFRPRAMSANSRSLLLFGGPPRRFSHARSPAGPLRLYLGAI